MAQLLRDLPARTGFLSRQYRGAANEEEDRPPVALDGENDDARGEEEVNQEEEDLERGWRGGGVVVGRLRRYVCDHSTDPPENQTLGNETQNILIRTLELRKRQERERAGAGKRKAPPSGKSGSGSGSGNSGTKPGGSGSTPRSASKRPRRRAGRG